MKTFIIINGSIIAFVDRESIEDARAHAHMFCDIAYEIIIKEVTDIIDNDLKEMVRM